MLKVKLSYMLFLLLSATACGQVKERMPVGNVGAPVTFKDVTLEIGQHMVFEFATADGKAPFGGADYIVECEPLNVGDPKATWVRGLVPVDGNVKNLAPGNMIDTAWVFASEDSPDFMMLRAVSGNRTAYRANITVNKKKQPDKPNPYLAALQAAALLDKAQPVDISNLVTAYRNVITQLPTCKTGKDVWSTIGIEYLRLSAGSMIQTRDAISKILMTDTEKYYYQQLDEPSMKALKLVLANIQKALEQIAVNPTPPPGPTPSPAPIPEPGFRVMIIYNGKTLNTLPITQSTFMRGQTLRDYLYANSVESDGTPAWRIWSDEVDATNDLPRWQTAYKRPRTASPWLIVSDGTKGFEGPLPTTLEATMDILKQIKGQ